MQGRGLAKGLFGVMFALLAGVALSQEEGVRVVDGLVYRSDNAIRLKTFHVPDAAQRGTGLDQMIPALARVAEVGGNTLSFDLWGFDDSGRKLDPAAVAAVTAYAERAKEQRMAVMVRVLAGVEDPDARSRAVRTAARAFKAENRVFYWIDGPDAGELAQRFKRYAAGLTVVAEANADIILLSSPDATRYEKTAYAIQGQVTDDPTFGFILDGTVDANYALADEKLMTEVERSTGELDPIIVSQHERDQGFVPLFNGRDLSGWWVFGDNPKGFHVSECGEIEWVEEGAGSLISAKRYENFILRLEYKLLPGYNSGIYLRAPREARQSRIGMEFQLHGDHGLETPNDDCTGAVYKVVPPVTVASKPGAEWNQLEIMMNGPMLRAVLNGVVVQDINLDDHEELRYRLRKGFIGLQDHSNYVGFRNIRIKELK